MKYYVYKHTFSNGTVYFGKGSSNRIYSNKRNRYWTNLYKRYGNPKREYLNTNISEQLAFILEKMYIEHVEMLGITTCNLSKGGEASASGHHHTAEAKLAISKGVSIYWKNKALLEGRVFTPSKTKNLFNRASICNKKTIIQLSKTGVFISEYASITLAKIATGVNSGNISSVCNNKLKTAGGFQWKYK